MASEIGIEKTARRIIHIEADSVSDEHENILRSQARHPPSWLREIT